MTINISIDPKVLNVLIELGQSPPEIFKHGDRDGITNLLAECSSIEHFELVKHLFQNFTYFTSADIEAGAKEVAKVIRSTWQLDPNTTQIIAITDDDKTDGAQVFAKSLDVAIKKPKYRIDTRLSHAFNPDSKTSSIVLIDDFIGSGEKFIKILERLSTHLKSNINIYVAALAGMTLGINNISKKLAGRVFVYEKLKKGISDLAAQEKIENFNKSMAELEIPIIAPKKKPGDKSFSFGYDRSEALFTLQGFAVPNNVFPVFWKNSYIDKSKLPKSLQSTLGNDNARATILSRS